MNTNYEKLEQQKTLENAQEEEENYLNLWSYLKRRYPDSNLDSKGFHDLVNLKTHLEGPRQLRDPLGELASVRKR